MASLLATMMAMDGVVILTFAGAALILALTPGSDMMFIIASGLSGGRRAAMMAVTGITAGVMTHVVIAAIGLAALIAAYPGLLTLIQYCGAAYLLWLAIASLQNASKTPNRQGRAAAMAALRRGYITNILNPKVALFILALLPQFTTPDAGPVWQQMLVLGLVMGVVDFAVTATIGLGASAIAARLARYQSWLDRLAALVFVGIAIRLVLPE